MRTELTTRLSVQIISYSTQAWQLFALWFFVCAISWYTPRIKFCILYKIIFTFWNPNLLIKSCWQSSTILSRSTRVQRFCRFVDNWLLYILLHVSLNNINILLHLYAWKSDYVYLITNDKCLRYTNMKIFVYRIIIYIYIFFCQQIWKNIDVRGLALTRKL